MKAYELLAYLKHLTLVGREDGDYQWVGKSKQWNEVTKEILYYETFVI